ncbi:hypothetical protein HK14_00530 [Acetobacter cibinongensis]|uniref:Uncharacterized protein n=1 Tax=Acetobacter cibinongensis TaxID=146475 RepID=A0A1Z5YZ62_9PROT|nr:hypothetical protein HK14_00530 [Acetobacter cibinongensis]
MVEKKLIKHIKTLKIILVSLINIWFFYVLFVFYVIGYIRNIKGDHAITHVFAIYIALHVFSLSFFIIALSWIATFFVRLYFKKKHKHENLKSPFS